MDIVSVISESVDTKENNGKIIIKCFGCDKLGFVRECQLSTLKLLMKSTEIRKTSTDKNSSRRNEFKKPAMFPKINWYKPMMIDFSDDEEETKQCEVILETIHLRYMKPINSISPIKTPPKKKLMTVKSARQLQEWFGTDSPLEPPERPITPGADIDILDINMFDI